MVLVVAALVISGGCGDSETTSRKTYPVSASTTVTTGSLSKAQFVARSNRICRNTWRRIDRRIAGFQARRQGKADQATLFAQATHSYILPGIQVAIFDDLHLLGAPEGESGEIERTIGSLQAGIDRSQKRRITSVPALETEFADFNRFAAWYGLDRCLVTGSQLPAVQERNPLQAE
jgi:hypothetical protein